MVRYFRKEFRYLKGIVDSIEDNVKNDIYDTRKCCLNHLRDEMDSAIDNIFTYQKERYEEEMGDDTIYLFTDGSAYNGRDGDYSGGWGYKIYLPINGKSITGHGAVSETTNNEMEILAVSKGLEKLSLLKDELSEKTIKIVTDSQYVANTFNKKWINNWVKNDWKNSSGGKIANVSFWKDLLKATIELDKYGINEIQYIWVKGHVTISNDREVQKELRRFREYNDLDTDLETFKTFFIRYNNEVDLLAKEGLILNKED